MNSPKFPRVNLPRLDVIEAFGEAKSLLAVFLENCTPAQAAELARLGVASSLAELAVRFERATAD